MLALRISAAADYYVDCAAGDDKASGTEIASPWRSLDKVSRTEFRPGDRIYFKRGTTCTGQLSPKGSGVAGAPITIAAYGDGRLPVIDAKGSDTAIRLFNQHHWVIRNLETTGSTEYGIHISGDKGTLQHIRLIDSVVHGVNSTEKMKTKISGLVVVEATGEQVFEDVIIEGVTAFGTNRWAGIVVLGRAFRSASRCAAFAQRHRTKLHRP